MTTPHGSAHEEWDELAAGFALDALEPDEEQRLLAHVETCAECRRALDEHALVAAQLGALAEDSAITPPAWSTIRRGVVGGRDDPVVSLDTERRRRRPPRILGAAAAAVLLAVGGVTAWQLTTDDTGPTGTIAACDASPSCHVVRLQGDATERAVVLAEKSTVTMVPTHMAPAAAGHVYALWQLPRDGRPTLVTVLRTVDNGTSSSAPLVLPYADTAAFAVSLEPSGVVPTHPTEVVATGTASA